MNNTIKYYNDNSKEFIGRTLDANISGSRELFLSYIPEGGYIADAGCGSGRDSLFFLKKEYKVLSFDASIEMVKFSSELTGQKTLHATFQDVELENNVFDGIWACASLLHVAKEEIEKVVKRLFGAIKPGGIFYMNFKYGDEDYVKDGRNFYIYNEETVKAVLSQIDKYWIVQQVIEQDGREELKHQKWISLMIKKL